MSEKYFFFVKTQMYYSNFFIDLNSKYDRVDEVKVMYLPILFYIRIHIFYR